MSQPQKRFFNSKDARALIDVYGFALFPIHGVVNGKCTCQDPACTNIGKHPATSHGLTDATKDIEVLKSLWAARPHLNVGIATGAISGIFVVDIDGPQGESDIAARGELPRTLTVKTGKGRHLFFKHPGTPVKTRRGVIGSKVDIRGDGGYVAGPGSNHATGAVYEWVNPLEEIVEAPPWLLGAITKEPERPEMPSPPLAPAARLISSNTWSESDAREMLSFLDPSMGYDEWIKVGMALSSEGFGMHLWDEWSRGAPAKYHHSQMAAHWRSFKPNQGITFGTLVGMAKDKGWGRTTLYTKAPPRAETVDPETGEIKESPKAPPQLILPPKDIITPNKAIIPYTMVKDITPNTESNDFVKGLLGKNQLSVVYGESNCGKTFFMTDLCFHIATGRQWRGRRVDKGGVIYAALEGSYGLRNRVEAYRRTHGLDNALFAMVTSQVDFLNPEGNIGQFIDTIKRASEEMGDCKIVVVDTLARALSGGDENSGQDMGMLVHHADRIRYETGAHANFVHHSGKNKALGARGHSSLRAAVDTEIEISRDDGADYSVIRVPKQREMEADEDMYFKLERVVIAVNGLSEEVSSCVVVPIDKDAVTKPKSMAEMTAKQKFVYEVILNKLAVVGEEQRPYPDGPKLRCITYEQFRAGLEEAGVAQMIDSESGNSSAEDKVKKFSQSAREQLKKIGKIGFNNRYIWII